MCLARVIDMLAWQQQQTRVPGLGDAYYNSDTVDAGLRGQWSGW